LLAGAGVLPEQDNGKQVASRPNVEGPVSTENINGAKNGKKKGPTCYRCGKPGHCLNDCVTLICDCCQSPDHISAACPLILAPKPTLTMYGLGHEELMFWEMPLSGLVRPRLENTRMGRVTISDGNMTVEEIIEQLRWIVPDDQ
jgi:hypothetical protein